MWGHFCRHKLAERPEQDIATWLKTRPPWKPCWNMLQTLAILNNLKTFLNNERPKDPMDKVRMQLATATAKQVPVTIPILWPLQSAQIHHVYSQCDREYMIIYAPRKVFGRSYIYIYYIHSTRCSYLILHSRTVVGGLTSFSNSPTLHLFWVCFWRRHLKGAVRPWPFSTFLMYLSIMSWWGGLGGGLGQ